MGQREQSLADGEVLDVTPIKRVINSSVPLIAQRWRGVCEGIIEGDQQRVLTLLQTNIFPAIQLQPSYQRLFTPILGWFLRGKSPGRSEAEVGAGTTYAEDAVLAVLGTIVQTAIKSEAKQSKDIVGAHKGKYDRTLTQVIKDAEDALRIVVIGQWLSFHQSPSAVRSLSQSIMGDNNWRHENKLTNTATLIVAQVIPQLESKLDSLEDARGGRKVVQTLRDNGETRRIEIKPPDEAATACLRSLVYDDDQGASASPMTMVATAMLCCIMAEHPWFEVVKAKSKRSKHVTSYLVLTDEAIDELTRDIPKWMSIVPQTEPMLVPPVDGGYLTSKGRKVTNKKSIRGYGTDVEGTDHWKALCKSMAETPWVSYTKHLDHQDVDQLVPEEQAAILAYSKLKGRQFYLPIRNDFRGRAYYQTHPVTAQGDDLKKSMLAFTPRPQRKPNEEELQHLYSHLCNLYGNGYDKESMPVRHKFMSSAAGLGARDRRDMLSKPEKPLQFEAHMNLFKAGNWEQIPCQIDGTCNGIQHLSAMFLDDEAGPYVNLVDHDKPADIYQRVAEKLKEKLSSLSPTRVSKLKIDRSFVKSSVMTLPYGVTRQGVEDQIIKKAAEQVMGDKALQALWLECLRPDGEGWEQDREAVDRGYLAYADRSGELISTHPLFRLDMRILAGDVWEAIELTIPKAMQAMGAFRTIGASIGDNVFAWRTYPSENPLWVVQSKSKEASRQLKFRGFHLPDVARSLSLRVKTDEINKGSHTSGIIANFIHSHDAHHQSLTCSLLDPGTAFASNHDSFWTRASSMSHLHEKTRLAFQFKYGLGDNIGHPLAQPCKIINPRTGRVEQQWSNWWSLAEEVGAKFPEAGGLDIAEVMGSKWFFS